MNPDSPNITVEDFSSLIESLFTFRRVQNPTLLDYSSIIMQSAVFENIEQDCDICYTEKDKFWKCLKCKRFTCYDCFKNIVDSPHKKCPTCRTPL